MSLSTYRARELGLNDWWTKELAARLSPARRIGKNALRVLEQRVRQNDRIGPIAKAMKRRLFRR
jgi:hypothetical protein